MWITSARLQVERKRKIYGYFVNGTTQSRSCFRCQKNTSTIWRKFFTEISAQMVSVPGPSLWYRCAAWTMRAGGDGKEGKRVSSYFLLSLPSSLRPLQMIRGRMASCKRRLETSQPPQSYNFWAGKLKSYLILKKCWRTSWVGSSTDEVVISLQEILDPLPGGYSGFFWSDRDDRGLKFFDFGIFGRYPKKYFSKCS